MSDVYAIPHIKTGPFPPEVRREIGGLQGSIISLHAYVVRFDAALKLFKFSTDRALERRSDWADPAKHFGAKPNNAAQDIMLHMEWSKIAQRDAAMTLHHFGIAMKDANDRAQKIPEVFSKLDRDRLGDAKKLLKTYFRHRDAIRNSVSHSADLMGSAPGQLRKHIMTGPAETETIKIDTEDASVMMMEISEGDLFTTTYNKEIYSFRLNDESLAHLRKIMLTFYSAFRPLAVEVPPDLVVRE